MLFVCYFHLNEIMLIQLITLQVVKGKNRMFGFSFCKVSILVSTIFFIKLYNCTLDILFDILTII